MIEPVMAISNLVLTRQIYSEETNGAHAHYREPVPLNARSLVKNQDALAHLLANVNHKFSVLAITDSSVKESNVNDLSFEGYSFVSNYRANKIGGGVGLFIDQNFSHKILPEEDFE